jgi:hypothetical protein
MITDTDRLVCGVAPCFGARAHGGIFWRAEEFECATCLGVTLLRPSSGDRVAGLMSALDNSLRSP